MAVVVYAGSRRFRTRDGGRDTRHSFSFGAHYDPGNVGFGALVCLNDDRLVPGAGYPDHPHADVEIVTWVLDGALRHGDADGDAVLGPGTVQVQSAGSGIRHSEVAEPGAGPTRFLQAWLRPDSPGSAPSPARRVHPDPGGPLVPVVGPEALRVGVAGARLWVGTVGPGADLELPDAPRTHLMVADGRLVLPGHAGPLTAGDAVRVTGGADPLRAESASRVAVWSLPG